MDSSVDLFYFIWNCKIRIFLIVYYFITLLYFEENWSGDTRKRMKSKKLLTWKLLIDFLRCLGMPKMKIKGHIGLKIVFGMICYHIGMHLSIVPSVHGKKKSGIWKGWVYAHIWFYQLAGSHHSLGMYVKIIIHSCLYLSSLPLNVYFIMFVNSQRSLVDLYM